MKQSALKRFIDKYTLGGEIKSVKWVSDGKSLSTRFISGDKSLVGSVKLDKVTDIDPSEVGVYNTAQLVSLMSILGEDIDFNYSQMGDKFVSVEMKDTNGTTSKYMLSDLSVIPTPPDLKNLPSEWDLEIKVDSQFINTFIGGKGALPDTESFTICSDENKTEVIIGFSNVATNRVTIPVSAERLGDISVVSFNASMFASILNANKECQSAVLKVSSQGIATISFNIDDYSSQYYLVATQQTN
mgnify:CR=1 FL=1|tara:strand:+ start:357 stop:1085 length:729 start_codon:yes stop_codon:yes gene_type:complete